MLNGKKTWLGLVLLGVGHMAKAAAPMFPEFSALLNVAGDYLVNGGAALATVGAAHKLVKGDTTTTTDAGPR